MVCSLFIIATPAFELKLEMVGIPFVAIELHSASSAAVTTQEYGSTHRPGLNWNGGTRADQLEVIAAIGLTRLEHFSDAQAVFVLTVTVVHGVQG